MAQVGVSTAIVSLDYGDGIKTAVTNSAGQYTYIAYMTEEEYNALPANFSIEAKKTGYTGVVASIAKPDFSSATASGVQIDAIISPVDPAQFSITPDSLYFTSTEGGTATITVNAPDNTWDFDFRLSSTRINVVRTDDTTLTVTVTADPNGGTDYETGYVTWGEAELTFGIAIGRL